ncbi:MAG: polyamine aminopropyltransferase [Candidatus Bathyarchaeia archaeon]
MTLEEGLPHREWHIDKVTDGYLRLLKIDALLYSGKTDYQKVKIFKNKALGKILVIDDDIQLVEMDEWVYHEALVHPALFTHPKPSRIAIIGGGDGGALREALKHRCVKEVFLVDIDRGVVEACRRLLPEVHGGSFDDPRVKFLHLDGKHFLKNPPRKFHGILIDLTEPTKGPSKELYSKPFYELVKRALTYDGVMSLQAGSAMFHWNEEASYFHGYSILASLFPIVRPYIIGVPSFGSLWCFLMASKRLDPLKVSRRALAKRMAERGIKTRYYTPELHKALFTLPKFFLEGFDVRKKNSY